MILRRRKHFCHREKDVAWLDYGMVDNLCLGCMRYLDVPDAPCPVCGWKRGAENQPHQLSPGSVLAGKYLVGRSLGQGGFGITYLAWDILRQCRLAIKEFFPGDNVIRQRDGYTVTPRDTQEARTLFAQGRERFFTEAQNLSQFGDDANIVTVLDFFQENETAYIVMEYVEGQTLKAYLASLGQPMLLGDALALLAPVARSLERVHAAGLLHRDISPDNIMITASGDIKLLDFGAARAFSLQGERSNTVNVKVGYAPKEQFQTHGEQGPWTDVYALAATIYNAITGVVPASTLDRWQGADTLRRPTSLGIRLLPAQEAVLLKGMAVEHKQRYRSVREFFSALTQAEQTGKAQSPLDDLLHRLGSSGSRAPSYRSGWASFKQLRGRSAGAFLGTLACAAGALALLLPLLLNGALRWRLEWTTDNAVVQFYLPALLSLICVAIYILDLVNTWLGRRLLVLRSPKTRTGALWAHILLLLGMLLAAQDTPGLPAVVVVYGLLTLAGILFARPAISQLNDNGGAS